MLPGGMSDGQVSALLKKCAYNDDKIQTAIASLWEDGAVVEEDEWAEAKVSGC